MVATASGRNHDFARREPGPSRSTTRTTRLAGVHDLLDDSGADAALDLFGRDVREQAFAALRQGGRLASVAQPPPEAREGHEVTYIFVRPSGFDLGEHITPLVAEGSLRPAIEDTFPLERAADAHERIEEGHVRGKLVLSVDRRGGSDHIRMLF